MKIREMMTPAPIVLNPRQQVGEVAIIFMENKIDGAPVVDENKKVIGLFTKSHIYRIITQGIKMETQVGELMTRDVITGHPDDEFEDVVFPTLPRMPVQDETGVVGMLTRGDIAKAFFDSYRTISSELDTIINSTYNMIISIDVQGKINVFNETAEKLLGMKAEELVGRDILEVLPTSGLTDVIKRGKEEVLQKIMINDRYFLSNRSPIKKDGQIIGAVAVLQDVSEFEKMSRELNSVKELNEELDAIIESSYDGLYITDGEGVTLRLNRAFEMISGINGNEFRGRNVEDIEKEGIVSQSVSSLVLEKKKPVTIIQETKVGRTTLATGNPVFDSQGRLIRVVCNVRDITELNMLKKKLEQARGLTQHYESQLRTLRLQYAGSDTLIIKASKMRNLLSEVMRIAQVDSTILITGESGTGKELIAETIHNNSTRNNGPFIKVNCGAIPENLLESELFGYDYGAFTGAKKEGKAGYFELASGGTIFLDEIGDLPYNLQVKLLRFLQNKEINRVGGVQSIKIDVRVLAASNRNLVEMVEKRQFREDLYYRLNVIPVHIPPLRERKEDLPSLVAHFMQLFNRKYKMNKRIEPELIDIFMQYDWPGNVRELENLMERLVVITIRDIIVVADLPSHINKLSDKGDHQVTVSSIMPLHEAVESVEKQLLKKAYATFRTTREMGKALQVNASTIVRKAAKYGINNGDAAN